MLFVAKGIEKGKNHDSTYYHSGIFCSFLDGFTGHAPKYAAKSNLLNQKDDNAYGPAK